MLDFFMRLFRGEPSGQTAKERLRLVLLSDHLALAPDVVEAMKIDLLAVISRYVEVDEANVEVTFEQRDREIAMLANIPIRSMKERENGKVSESFAPEPVAPPPPVALVPGSPGRPRPRRRRRKRAALKAAALAQAHGSGAVAAAPEPVDALAAASSALVRD